MSAAIILKNVDLPPPTEPLSPALPQRVDIPGLGVQAPVVARGLDGGGAIDPPPYDQAGVVGWYAAGVKPGAAGAALMVGHVDTETRPAVFYKLSALKPGETVRVIRDDGRVAEQRRRLPGDEQLGTNRGMRQPSSA